MQLILFIIGFATYLSVYIPRELLKKHKGIRKAKVHIKRVQLSEDMNGFTGYVKQIKCAWGQFTAQH